tara:strand:- start:27494 stop:27880 length:387 start_codon:yes stop_codon:yes gene_type:complete
MGVQFSHVPQKMKSQIESIESIIKYRENVLILPTQSDVDTFIKLKETVCKFDDVLNVMHCENSGINIWVNLEGQLHHPTDKAVSCHLFPYCSRTEYWYNGKLHNIYGHAPFLQEWDNGFVRLNSLDFE